MLKKKQKTTLKTLYTSDDSDQDEAGKIGFGIQGNDGNGFDSSGFNKIKQSSGYEENFLQANSARETHCKCFMQKINMKILMNY